MMSKKSIWFDFTTAKEKAKFVLGIWILFATRTLDSEPLSSGLAIHIGLIKSVRILYVGRLVLKQKELNDDN